MARFLLTLFLFTSTCPAIAQDATTSIQGHPLWSGEFQLRFDTYRGVLPLPDDGVPPTIDDFRRHELPDRNSDLGIRQLARVQAHFNPTPHSSVRLTLRNYGYWGVGYYTSGTYGVQAFTADPFSLEDFALYFPALRGTVSIGAQYFQFGPVGLLAATPLSDADGIPHPIHAVIWERWFDDIGVVGVAGRLLLEFDEDDRPVASDEYTALRIVRDGEHGQFGVNLLLSGRGKERGLSWDMALPELLRLEIAVAQETHSSAWQPALYGDVFLGSETRRLQLGYAANPFPLLYTQMADRGGMIPLAQGQMLIGLEQIWPIGSTSLAHGHIRHRIGDDLAHQWEANLGWNVWLAENTWIETDWTQWIGSDPTYGRFRTLLQFNF